MRKEFLNDVYSLCNNKYFQNCVKTRYTHEVQAGKFHQATYRETGSAKHRQGKKYFSANKLCVTANQMTNIWFKWSTAA